MDIDTIKWKGGNLQLKRQNCRTNNCVTLQTSRFYTGYETLLWSNIPIARHGEMSVTSIPTNSHVLNYVILLAALCGASVGFLVNVPSHNVTIVTGLQCQDSRSVQASPNTGPRHHHSQYPVDCFEKTQITSYRDELNAQWEPYNNPQLR